MGKHYKDMTAQELQAEIAQLETYKEALLARCNKGQVGNVQATIDKYRAVLQQKAAA